mmetsp:Transcript_29389/g.88015  ORF Transcript_29389/g.88015 Transcript_29389/m.88015 type:complete len:206 (+) Transcript_29389:55-672(+)
MARGSQSITTMEAQATTTTTISCSLEGTRITLAIPSASTTTCKSFQIWGRPRRPASPVSTLHRVEMRRTTTTRVFFEETQHTSGAVRVQTRLPKRVVVYSASGATAPAMPPSSAIRPSQILLPHTTIRILSPTPQRNKEPCGGIHGATTAPRYHSCRSTVLSLAAQFTIQPRSPWTRWSQWERPSYIPSRSEVKYAARTRRSFEE